MRAASTNAKRMTTSLLSRSVRAAGRKLSVRNESAAAMTPATAREGSPYPARSRGASTALGATAPTTPGQRSGFSWRPGHWDWIDGHCVEVAAGSLHLCSAIPNANAQQRLRRPAVDPI